MRQPLLLCVCSFLPPPTCVRRPSSHIDTTKPKRRTRDGERAEPRRHFPTHVSGCAVMPVWCSLLVDVWVSWHRTAAHRISYSPSVPLSVTRSGRRLRSTISTAPSKQFTGSSNSHPVNTSPKAGKQGSIHRGPPESKQVSQRSVLLLGWLDTLRSMADGATRRRRVCRGRSVGLYTYLAVDQSIHPCSDRNQWMAPPIDRRVHHWTPAVVSTEVNPVM